MDKSLAELRVAFQSGRTRSHSWRRSQLRALLKMLREEEDGMFEALEEDLGKHRVEAYRDEVGVLIKSINFALENLKPWMAPQQVWVPVIAHPSKGEVVPEPLGLVLIFSSWNFPIGLALEPLIGAVAAGNVAALKLSELAPSTAAFLATTIPKYLDRDAIKVFQGRSDVGQQLLEHKWDKIFFTGSPRVGRIIMTAAAKYLTPVVLELGGKCPAIVDSISNQNDQKLTAKRIFAGKWAACFGQACVGVDYVLVEQKFASTLIDLLKMSIKSCFIHRSQYSRIVNQQHFLRLKGMLEDPLVKACIVHGGAIDSDQQYIEPTILLDPPLDSEIMTEEIFGPLLPIIILQSVDDSIEFINNRPKPLAIYAFTNNENLKRRIIDETSSGSVTFNDTIIQFAVDTLPFGGVGQSGFGSYHGKFSFDTFSHQKAVLRRNFTFDIVFRYPPWNELKMKFIRAVYNFDYLNLLLLALGLKRN